MRDYYEHIIVQMSPETKARMDIVCENHRIRLKELVDSILKNISDEELLKAVKPISRVLKSEKH